MQDLDRFPAGGREGLAQIARLDSRPDGTHAASVAHPVRTVPAPNHHGSNRPLIRESDGTAGRRRAPAVST